jgi:hypothetical protein
MDVVITFNITWEPKYTPQDLSGFHDFFCFFFKVAMLSSLV